MRINKNGLDEMQRERRNSIGNQMFMLMFYTLLLDIGLYGAGIRWMNYPANIMVIIMVYMIIYLVRTIAANAYLPPKAQNRKTAISLIIAICFSVVLVISGFSIFGDLSATRPELDNAGDNSAFILFIISAAGLLISLIVVIIKKVNEKNFDDE